MNPLTNLGGRVLRDIEGRIMDRVLGLPPVLTRDVKVTKGIRVAMPDGIELLADLYQPNVPNAPTVMSRTPYARVGLASRATAMPFAQRGFNVLIQSVRGTHGGSGGEFDPLAGEEKDALATLAWIEEQPWYNGQLFLFGPSYVGYTQFALAVGAGDRVAGLLPTVTSSSLSEVIGPGGTVFTGLVLQWIRRMALLERSAALADLIEFLGDRRTRRAQWHLPLGTSDLVNTGRAVGFYRTWLEVGFDRKHPYWNGIRECRDRIGGITAPTHLLGGWQDLALPSQLTDYHTMRAAGRDPLLTIGPWTHVDTAMMGAAITEAVEWFRAVAENPAGQRARRAKLYIQGADEWRTYDVYPPAESEARQWFLHPSGGFSPVRPDAGEPRVFRYDPADPTPDIGGAAIDTRDAGRRDQTDREARADVLVYTSAALEGPLELIGPVTSRVVLRTSSPHADLFIRLCDVDPQGRSTNVCDGIQRTTPDTHPADANGLRTAEVTLWPTAYRFKPGHRLRIQVCGGSFPRFARNTGSGEPLATATTLVPVDFEIHPGSGLTLPVMRANPDTAH
ncbi:CocE/NonD family hydrolase [Nocardia sp. NPDC127526]|uniref:CocE/NonD family hydrolase n=1 Tax=Nocardia sp. NPDC127526 TaxID=3345393 RepID=UPI0036315388